MGSSHRDEGGRQARRKPMRARWFFATLATCFAMTVPARADVVGPPEENCPPGSMGATSHAGPYCAPDLCTADTDPDRCTAAQHCEDRRLCVKAMPCGGMQAPDSAPCTFSSVTATCFSNNSCAQGTCQTLSVCVSNAASGGSSAGGGPNQGGSGGQGTSAGTGGSEKRDLSQDSGCGCRVGGPAGRSWVGALVVVGWLGVRRGSRRRRRGADGCAV
jgi:MYXO-CTERM domain-containing protein